MVRCMATVDITGIDKASLLAALYNSASPMGMGMLHYDPNVMTREDALVIIEGGDDLTSMFGGSSRGRSLYFDYVKGRPLKVDLSGDTLDTRLYDRDQGNGAAAKIIAKLQSEARQ